jgi:hypothetical protein
VSYHILYSCGRNQQGYWSVHIGWNTDLVYELVLLLCVLEFIFCNGGLHVMWLMITSPRRDAYILILTLYDSAAWPLPPADMQYNHPTPWCDLLIAVPLLRMAAILRCSFQRPPRYHRIDLWLIPTTTFLASQSTLGQYTSHSAAVPIKSGRTVNTLHFTSSLGH